LVFKANNYFKIVEKCKPEGLCTLPTDDVMSGQNENNQLVCVSIGVKWNIVSAV